MIPFKSFVWTYSTAVLFLKAMRAVILLCFLVLYVAKGGIGAPNPKPSKTGGSSKLVEKLKLISAGKGAEYKQSNKSPIIGKTAANRPQEANSGNPSMIRDIGVGVGTNVASSLIIKGIDSTMEHVLNSGDKQISIQQQPGQIPIAKEEIHDINIKSPNFGMDQRRKFIPSIDGNILENRNCIDKCVHGRCISEGCICLDGYSGYDCSTPSLKSTEYTPYIIGGGVIIGLIIILAIAVVCCRKLNSSKANIFK